MTNDSYARLQATWANAARRFMGILHVAEKDIGEPWGVDLEVVMLICGWKPSYARNVMLEGARLGLFQKGKHRDRGQMFYLPGSKAAS